MRIWKLAILLAAFAAPLAIGPPAIPAAATPQAINGDQAAARARGGASPPPVRRRVWSCVGLV